MASTEVNESLDRVIAVPDCSKQLSMQPRAMYSPADRLGMLWSAKAGCTFAVKWFFFQIGVLDEAMEYSEWPHHYREQVYCARAGYADDLADLPALGPRAIKFVRDPFGRAVGGYLSITDQIHQLTHPPHAAILEGLAGHLGRPIGDGESLSFREFVGYLEAIDLDKCDVHLRRQVAAAERAGCLPEMTVLRIEDSKSELPRLEREFDLRESDIDALVRSHHHTQRSLDTTFAGDEHFTKSIGPPMPPTPAFYDEELTDRVKRLYAEDFERYGYADSVIGA